MNLVDLQTRGFVVIKNFIDPLYVKNLIADYYSTLQLVAQGHSTDYPKYHHYNILPSKTPHGLNKSIELLLEQIRNVTDLQVDFCESTGDYFDTNLKQYNWHLDHEEYYLYQNAYHNLNFWIPLIKPNADESGICVIPYDKLGDEQALIHARGAASFSRLNKKYTVMQDENLGGKHLIKLNFDEVCETPSINVGDCLVLRGDIIHRTQTITTPRVAYSTRCFASNIWISKSNFMAQCTVKSNLIENNPELYHHVITAFEQKEHVQVGEVLKQVV